MVSYWPLPHQFHRQEKVNKKTRKQSWHRHVDMNPQQDLSLPDEKSLYLAVGTDTSPTYLYRGFVTCVRFCHLLLWPSVSWSMSSLAHPIKYFYHDDSWKCMENETKEKILWQLLAKKSFAFNHTSRLVHPPLWFLFA